MKGNIGIQRFLDTLPNSEICLTNLFNAKFGWKSCDKCRTEESYHLVKGRKCFQCRKCSKQVYPLKGTVMENSKTDIRKWLIAIFLISKSKNGYSAMRMAEDIEVTYKCAWRICRLIRKAMSMDEIKDLDGIVEIDETYVGGKFHGFYSHSNKTAVLGICQRKGRIKTFVIKSASEKNVLPLILATVSPGALICTDEHSCYRNLSKHGFRHESVKHKDREWARNGITTNRIENCWSRFKNSIRGTYIRIRKSQNEDEPTLEYYLAEYDFRHNHRNETNVAKFLKLTGLVGFDLSEFFLGGAEVEK
jgi:transposase-like protein